MAHFNSTFFHFEDVDKAAGRATVKLFVGGDIDLASCLNKSFKFDDDSTRYVLKNIFRVTPAPPPDGINVEFHVFFKAEDPKPRKKKSGLRW